MRTVLKAMASAALAAGLAAVPPVLGQGTASYEPSHRLRVGALDNCLKDEVMHKAHCVKQCQPDFRLDLSDRKPRCIATKPGARYVPPPPEYVPPVNSKPGAPGS